MEINPFFLIVMARLPFPEDELYPLQRRKDSENENQPVNNRCKNAAVLAPSIGFVVWLGADFREQIHRIEPFTWLVWPLIMDRKCPGPGTRDLSGSVPTFHCLCRLKSM